MFRSTLLNNNPSAFTSWKGKSFDEITSFIQKNDNNHLEEKRLFFKPTPLKIYRREIHNIKKQPNNVLSRHSASVELLERPGSTLVKQDENCECTGNKQALDIPNLQNDRCHDKETNKVIHPESVARSRVRSAGMIKKKPPSHASTTPYFTSSKQYLASRGKSFGQNQYHFLKTGNANVKPGAPGSEDNKYSINNNGAVYCPKNPNYYAETQYKPNNHQFGQDGGVSSSARTTRLNYNTITTNGGLYTKAYGANVGNALSYGASSDAYTIKQKIGYPAPSDTTCIGKK